MKGFILGFLCAAALYVGLHYQFIRTSDDLIVVRKSEIGFLNTVVDIRDWTVGDFLKNPAITKTLAARGLGKLVDQAMESLPKPEVSDPGHGG
ncbi:MAG: hypothetical protein LBM75_07595 [Myxococcales bacterium]|jgi:hypothetical protein|nr:hypothetical protein [Myxococcales bacterium]